MKMEYSNPDAIGTAKFFINLGKKKEANTVLDMIYPLCNTMEQLDAVGQAYATNRNFTKSLEIAVRQLAKARNPTEMWDCRVNVIRCYLNLNRPDEALKYIRANKVINPTDQPNLMDEAYALFLLNRKDEGERILRHVVSNPDSQDILNRCTFNLGSYDLRAGNFKLGMREVLLGGRAMDIWKELDIPNAQWRGEDATGKTVVVFAEGGYGDEIINVRFMYHIQQRGMNPVWLTDRQDMIDVFKRNGFQAISSRSEIQHDWLWTYSMLVPVWLDLDACDLWNGPYLQATGDVVLKPIGKSVGIKTSGNPDYDQDLARSVSVEQLVDAIPSDYTIYSFHKDEIIEHPRVINWMTNHTTWEDTMNAAASMDAIVSTCTSLPHMSSAMGVKTIIMTPILKYYLWAGEEATSPWYGDTTTVLHQSAPNDWSSVIAQIRSML